MTSWFTVIVMFFWELLKVWGSIFIIPFTSMETVWIIVPIWLSWVFTEFFQEKKGTSFGNAIANGIIPLWVGIDWLRQLTTGIVEGTLEFSLLIAGKYTISALVLIYGLSIIIFGIKGRSFVKYAGRIREVTYVLVVFTPFIYGEVAPTYQYFLSIVLFFPVFYLFVEFLDWLVPEPEAFSKDVSSADNSFFSDTKGFK